MNFGGEGRKCHIFDSLVDRQTKHIWIKKSCKSYLNRKTVQCIVVSFLPCPASATYITSKPVRICRRLDGRKSKHFQLKKKNERSVSFTVSKRNCWLVHLDLFDCRSHQMYYMFGFLFLVFIILVITCSEATILLCYFHLCAEVCNSNIRLCWFANSIYNFGIR